MTSTPPLEKHAGPRKAAASARVAFFSQELARFQASRPPGPASPRRAETLEKRAKVFYRHAEQGWLVGVVHRVHNGRQADKLYSLSPTDLREILEEDKKGKGGHHVEDASDDDLQDTTRHAGKLLRFKRDELVPASPESFVPVADLLNVAQIHECELLTQLRIAFDTGGVYLRVGPRILVSVNPGVVVPKVYSEALFDAFLDTRPNQGVVLPPHVWGLSRHMFSLAVSRSHNAQQPPVAQALVFTGPPGSGKTEAANLALRFFTTAATLQANAGEADWCEALADLVMRVGPVIDAFGNATQQKFTNSSRLTKWTELLVSGSGTPVGVRFEALMLERHRVVAPPSGERSFHVFYHLLASLDDTSRKRLGLEDPSAYEWLYQNLVVTDDDEPLDAAAYASNRRTLMDVGLSSLELESMDKVLAGIIHLRSINVANANAKGLVEWTPQMEERLRMAAALWGVEAHELFGEVAAVSVAAGKVQTRRTRPHEAAAARDGICKAVYTGLLEWLLKRINEELEPQRLLGEPVRYVGIGLLDVFGYESTQSRPNDLEQLLFNTANDEIQQVYCRDVFNEEVDECQQEGIDVMGLVPPDVTPTVELVTEPPFGLFALLNEPRSGIDNLFAEVHAHHRDHPSLEANTEGTLGIKHHSGWTLYGGLNGWRARNNDRSKGSVVEFLRGSVNAVVRALAESADAKATLCESYTTGMAKIRSLLQGKELNWCRCIRPDYSLGQFAGALVLGQVAAHGLVETVRVRMNCYPVRLPHDYFLARYKAVLRGSSYDAPGVTVASVLQFAGLAEAGAAQVGATKVFLKDYAHAHLEDLRTEFTNPTKMITGFIASSLAQKQATAAPLPAGVMSPRAKLKAAVTLVTAQQSVKILTRHLPAFLAFARGRLAFDRCIRCRRHALAPHLKQLVTPATPPASVPAEPDPHLDSAVASHNRILADRRSRLSTTASTDDKPQELQRGVLAISAPLRKLVEWKRSSLQITDAKPPMDPPPMPFSLPPDTPLRTHEEILGPLIPPQQLTLSVPQLDPCENDFRDPQMMQHDYRSIILKEADALRKMAPDELFEVLGQGKREVNAPLSLSPEAMQAIRELVKQGALHEKHCSRVKAAREQAAEELGEKRYKRQKGMFPDSLGPLQARPCPGVVTSVRDGRYTCPLQGPLAKLMEAGVPGEGRVSPESPVTLPLPARRKANIPRLATTFVWAYPLPGMQGLMRLGLDAHSGAVTFVTYGGFVYLDRNGVPLSANALGPGVGLSFLGPHVWERNEITRRIEKSGRMQPITIQQLADAGAKYFCWLLPEEDIGLDPVPVHGGYVYLFREIDEDPSPDDRYFVIAGEGEKEDAIIMEAFKLGEQDQSALPPNALVELPRIEGMKELEGVVVHRRVANAIQEVIESDMEVQKVRRGMEPLNPFTMVSIVKQQSTVSFAEKGVLSPARLHLRRPDEFVDVEGGYLGWSSGGVAKRPPTLDFSGKTFPFPNGISSQLSPTRTMTFLTPFPASSRTAFGKSVDGKRPALAAPPAASTTPPKSVWLHEYQHGYRGGAPSPTVPLPARAFYRRPDEGDSDDKPLDPPKLQAPSRSAVRTAYETYGRHAGRTVDPSALVKGPAFEPKPGRYLDTIQYEINRQHYK
ncbi:Myosin-3 [Diplonema papillatum]|nr:Myosin-3 [Diplonema papillatum]